MIPQFTIMLDPGHGGDDPGCVFGDFLEAGWVWDQAERIVNLLLDTSWPINIKLSRTGPDDDPSLDTRAAIAAMARADFVLSLHVNGIGDAREHGALGFRMYGRPYALDCCQAFLASLNRPGEYVDAAGHVRPMLSRIHTATLLDSDGNKSWKARAFHVLAPHKSRPAALHEHGYASNAEELAWLISDEGKAACALANVRAIGAVLKAAKFLN